MVEEQEDGVLPKESYLLLYASCLFTKGVKRSSIVDFQREEFYLVPNEVGDILQESKKQTYQEVKSMFRKSLGQERFNLIMNELFQNELVYLNENPAEFPAFNLNYESPHLLTNAILDWSFISAYDWKSAIKKLSDLGVRHFQFRFFDPVSVGQVEELCSDTNDLDSIITIELLLPFTVEFSEDQLKELVKSYFKIKRIVVHHANEDSVVQRNSYAERLQMGQIIFTKQQISSEQHCGFISPEYFQFSNIQSIAENYNRNGCLNQKISVDQYGQIKNCPALPQEYGNVDDTSLENILSEDFKKYWFITKDQIETCQDCEFRLICSDCRAFTENSGSKFSKPEKCNYDPYTCTYN